MTKRAAKTAAPKPSVTGGPLSREALMKHRAGLVDLKARLEGALDQLRAQTQEVIGRLNQNAGAIDTVDRLLATEPEPKA